LLYCLTMLEKRIHDLSELSRELIYERYSLDPREEPTNKHSAGIFEFLKKVIANRFLLYTYIKLLDPEYDNIRELLNIPFCELAVRSSSSIIIPERVALAYSVSPQKSIARVLPELHVNSKFYLTKENAKEFLVKTNNETRLFKFEFNLFGPVKDPLAIPIDKFSLLFVSKEAELAWNMSVNIPIKKSEALRFLKMYNRIYKDQLNWLMYSYD